jgi:hypothetical protein
MVDDQIDRHQRLDAPRIEPRSACATWRIAARSQSSGTPVKSCSTTRATTKGISSLRSAAVAIAPARRHVRSSELTRDVAVAVTQRAASRTMRSDTGRRSTLPMPAAASAGSE